MRGASFASSFPRRLLRRSTTIFRARGGGGGGGTRGAFFGERRKPVLVVVVVVSAEHRRVAHFVNLKNGIEALPVLREHFPEDAPIHFLRVQSTLCERGDMEKIMLELDANLLLKLATDTPVRDLRLRISIGRYRITEKFLVWDGGYDVFFTVRVGFRWIRRRSRR